MSNHMKFCGCLKSKQDIKKEKLQMTDSAVTTLINGYTVCPYCLKTVRVIQGLLGYHIPDHWAKTCPGFKTDAEWAEKHPLDAGGRNSNGVCMKCGETVTNPDCPQCNYKRRHRD